MQQTQSTFSPAQGPQIDRPTSFDIRTGETVWSKLTGTGLQWNNHDAAIYLGPDGVAYVATLAGVVRVQDRP